MRITGGFETSTSYIKIPLARKIGNAMRVTSLAAFAAVLSLFALASAEETEGAAQSETTATVDSTAWSVAAFSQAFGESFAVILATEIGDRTFFIAAIMAMRHSRFIVWAGAVGALIVMTVLSTLVGHVAPLLIPRAYTHYAAAALFLYFGIKMLRDGFSIEHAGERSNCLPACHPPASRQRRQARHQIGWLSARSDAPLSAWRRRI